MYSICEVDAAHVNVTPRGIKQVVISASCPSCTTLKKTILICQIRGDLTFLNSSNIFVIYVYIH